MTWNGQKTDPEDGAVINLNTAYMDATDETDFTAGVNALWHRFELGYIYAHNKIEAFNATNIDAVVRTIVGSPIPAIMTFTLFMPHIYSPT